MQEYINCGALPQGSLLSSNAQFREYGDHSGETMAQAPGDQQALQGAARPMMRIHIQTAVDQGIQLITEALQRLS